MVLSNMTIKARIALAFGFLCVLLLTVSIFSLNALRTSKNDFAAYLTGIDARADLVVKIRSAVDRRAIAARNLILVTDPADIAQEEAAVRKAHQEIQDYLVRLKTMMLSDDDGREDGRALVVKIAEIEQDYGPVALEIVNLALSGKAPEAILMMNSQCRPLLAALIKSTDDFATYTEQRATEKVAIAERHYSADRNIMLLLCAIAFIGAALACYLISSSIRRALGAEPDELSEVARQVAGGDLTNTHFHGTVTDGSVLASLKEMQIGLIHIVQQVRSASSLIASSASEIADANMDLSQRTEEQASNLEQTAASMEEITSTVTSNADTALEVSALASAASNAAKDGGEVVRQVVSTMEDISESSKKIADITGVIDGIAFQTNILALNAAVEAARAGEQGRGFAVVASEVRSLAQRSASAAKEIKTLITESVGKVQLGTTQVSDAGAKMTDIVLQIEKVTNLVYEISNATKEQTSGIALVSDAVASLDQMTQQNAALVEESAASAESLNQQARSLEQVVGLFNTAAPTSAT
jgi:methyl-accepting chemotaxis protein-1 (serine sensor receptor)